DIFCFSFDLLGSLSFYTIYISFSLHIRIYLEIRTNMFF
uniref:Uncharacterized protein n=1 Tax=Cucumis melo TaxID=3656 RepID=A0A9I9EFI9_CUCME